MVIYIVDASQLVSSRHLLNAIATAVSLAPSFRLTPRALCYTSLGKRTPQVVECSLGLREHRCEYGNVQLNEKNGSGKKEMHESVRASWWENCPKSKQVCGDRSPPGNIAASLSNEFRCR